MDAVENNKRLLTLRFRGDAVRSHAISVRLFTKTLESVQKLLLHLTESRLEKEPRKQGRSSATVAAECELFLQSIEANCVTAKLSLPVREESLFPDFPDLPETILNDARSSFVYYSRGEFNPFWTICPNPVHRKQVLADLADIAPNKRSDYTMHFVGNDNREESLCRPPQGELRKILAAIATEIPSGTADEPRFIAARGMAIMRGENIVNWTETYDVQELDLEAAWRPNEIVWGDDRFKLVHAIAISIEEQTPDIVVASYEILGIVASGTNRAEAMQSFAQEFSVIWHEIALENDENLTPDAIELKRKLFSLVESAEPV
jgi:hypothetical protein